MQLLYRLGEGKLIWAITTCCPDLAYTAVKLSQSNTAPHEIHYHGLKHALKFLYNSRDHGIYFWRTSPRPNFPVGPTLGINSNNNNILLDACPQFDALCTHAYADLDWATCPKTQRSFGGACIHLAGKPSHINSASNLPSQDPAPKLNLWLLVMLKKWSSIYAAFYGTSTFPKRRQPSSMKTMMAAQQLATPRNQLPGHGTST